MAGDDFESQEKRTYKWPQEFPVIERVPLPPDPVDFKGTLKMKSLRICGCGEHPHENQLEMYLRLSNREDQLCEEYKSICKQKSDLAKEIIQHPCGDLDSKIASIYQIDYTRKNLPMPDYKSLLPVPESLPPYVPSPSLWPSFIVSGETSIDLTTMETLRCKAHEEEDVSEYTDSISKPALATWRAAQCYKYPRPSIGY